MEAAQPAEEPVVDGAGRNGIIWSTLRQVQRATVSTIDFALWLLGEDDNIPGNAQVNEQEDEHNMEDVSDVSDNEDENDLSDDEAAGSDGSDDENASSDGSDDDDASSDESDDKEAGRNQLFNDEDDDSDISDDENDDSDDELLNDEVENNAAQQQLQLLQQGDGNYGVFGGEANARADQQPIVAVILRDFLEILDEFADEEEEDNGSEEGEDQGNHGVEGQAEGDDEALDENHEEAVVPAISVTLAKPGLLLLFLLVATVIFGLGFISGQWMADNKPRTQQALGVVTPVPADRAGAAQTVMAIPPSFVHYFKLTKTKAIVGVSKEVVVKPQAGDPSAHEFQFRLDGRASSPPPDAAKPSAPDYTPHLRGSRKESRQQDDDSNKTTSKKERLRSRWEPMPWEEGGDFMQGPWVD